MMTILTSYLSTIIVLTSTLLNMPYFIFDEKSKYPQMETQFKSFWNWIFVLPIMILTATPRLVLLAINFTICRGIIALIINVLLLIFHFFMCLNLMDTYGSTKGLKEQYILSMITSIFGPAMEIDPRKNILIGSSLAAMSSHLLLDLVLIVIVYFSPLSLVKNVLILQTYRDNVLFPLIPILIITTMFIFFLREEQRQLFFLRLKRKPPCCEKDEQLIWAMSRKYKKLINRYSETKSSNFSEYCKVHHSLQDKKIIFENAFSHHVYGEKLCEAFTSDMPLLDNPLLAEVKESMSQEGNFEKLVLLLLLQIQLSLLICETPKWQIS